MNADSATAMTLLGVKGAVKDYSGQRALDHMDFELRAGEIHALLGENGAGKSTLIKAIGGAIPLTAGEIAVNGERVDIRSPHDSRRHGVSIVHQHGNLIPGLSVRENVLMAEGLPRAVGVFVGWRAASARVRVLLDEVGLEHVSVRADVADLSPHEQAMVAIAKALASKARVIVLDEPTTALQSAEVETLFARMRRLAEEGIGFVFVTHRLAEVFRVADRITVMRDGRLVGTWPTGQLDHDRLVDQLVGPERAAAARLQLERGAVGDAVVLAVAGLTNATLRGVDLQVRAGEVVGVASLPGEGADDLIESLFGIRRHGGRVDIDGRPVSTRTPRAAIRAGFALVPRDRLRQGLVSEMSVRENATLAATNRFLTDPVLRLLRRRRERRAVAEVTGRLSLKAPSLEAEVRSLSGGNQQKVVIARWLLRGASVYLLDSPTNAVDVHTKAEIYGLARELAAQGAAVVFTTTETEEFVRLCDRVIVLHAGEIAGELRGDEITVNAIMRLSFGRENV